MSQNTNRKSIDQRWQRLPLYIRLIAPLAVGLLLAVIIAYAIIQAPINSLSQANIGQAFNRESAAAEAKLSGFFDPIVLELTAATSVREMSDMALAQFNNNPAAIKNNQPLLGSALTDALTGTTA